MRRNDDRKQMFAGNGLSRTAMVYKIATIANHTLTVTELNKIKLLNPRALENVYNEVVGKNDPGSARFALHLLLK